MTTSTRTSQSLSEGLGPAIAEDDMANDDTGDWDVSVGSIAFDIDHYEITNAGTQKVYVAGIGYTAGKVYQISIDVKDGTETGETIETYFQDGVAEQFLGSAITTGSWVTRTSTATIANTTANGRAGIRAGSCNNNNLELKNFSISEVVRRGIPD